MSSPWSFSIIGDGNVVDNMTSFNTASRDIMKKARVINCPALSKICEAFQSVRFVRYFPILLDVLFLSSDFNF